MGVCCIVFDIDGMLISCFLCVLCYFPAFLECKNFWGGGGAFVKKSIFMFSNIYIFVVVV